MALKRWVWDWAGALTGALWLIAVAYAVWVLMNLDPERPPAEGLLAIATIVVVTLALAQQVLAVRAGQPGRLARAAEAARYEAVIAAVSAVLQQVDERTLLSVTMAAIRAIAAATHVALFVRDRSTGVMSLLDADPGLTPDEIAACVSIAARVAETGEEVFSLDPADPLLAGFPPRLRANSYYACVMAGASELPTILILLSNAESAPLSHELLVPVRLLAVIGRSFRHRAQLLQDGDDEATRGLLSFAQSGPLIAALEQFVVPQIAALEQLAAGGRPVDEAGAPRDQSDDPRLQTATGLLTLRFMVPNLKLAQALARNELLLQSESVDVARLAAEVIHSLGSLVEPRAVRLIDASAGRPARADRARLRQIIENLLLNASAYSEPGAPIDLAVHVEPERVHVEVRDLGPGLGIDERERVWDAFYRSPRHARIPGIGIGLTLVRALVLMQYGNVWFDSRARSTRVGFWLPAASGTSIVPRQERESDWTR